MKLYKINKFTLLLSFILFLFSFVFLFSEKALAASSSVVSTKSGNWSDPTVWSTNTVPTSEEQAIISSTHIVTYDLNATNVSGLKIEADAELLFDPSNTTTLQSDENIIVLGKLTMKPSAPSVLQTIRFINVDETKFTSGGMDPRDTDVGLWVMGAGKLDIEGTSKTSWTRAAGAIAQGTNTITLIEAPTGWQVGDVIRISPTEGISAGTPSWSTFDGGTITAISGNTITLSANTSRPHPMINNKWTAEVMNLTRNVRIEGTGNGATANTTNGRAHVFIRSSQPQSIKYLALKLMGPRKKTSDTYLSNGVRVPIYEAYVGRYALHFHHNMDGSRGTIVEGVVANQSGAHVFVPHASHGILMKDLIAYDSWDDPFWWDPPPDNESNDHNSNDITWDHNIAAIVKVDPSFRGAGMSAFFLSTGANPVLRNSVAVGVQGNVTASGFHWPESANHHPLNIWTFEDNIAHNNKVDGIYTWQNDLHGHLVNRFAAYNNGEAGIEHGAYMNAYNFLDTELIGNGKVSDTDTASILMHATPQGVSRPDGYKLVFERFTADTQIVLTKHNQSNVNGKPILFKDCNLITKINPATGLPYPKVIVNEKFDSGTKAAWTDFVNCNLEPTEIKIITAVSGSRIRVQRSDSSAYQMNYLGQVTTIPAFYLP